MLLHTSFKLQRLHRFSRCSESFAVIKMCFIYLAYQKPKSRYNRALRTEMHTNKKTMHLIKQGDIKV